MKTKLTTIIRILVLGLVLMNTQTDLLRAQMPVELYQTEVIGYSSSSNSLLDCSTAPVISCPSIYFGCPGDEINPDVTGYATAVAGDAFCDEPIVTYEDNIISSGPCEGAVIIHRIWTAKYPNETNEYLYADCTQLILLSDDEGPQIQNCPSNILISPGEDCEAIVSWTNPSATDNCGLESLTSDYSSGASFPLGITNVTYTATDLCGNTSICTFEINVAGSCCFDPPTLVCPPDFVGCPSDGSSTDVTGVATAMSINDNCGEIQISFSDELISNGPCVGAMEIQRTWIATYVNEDDLESSCVQNITLEDSKSPIISNLPLDITVVPDENCLGQASWTAPAATDNCGVPSLVSNFSSGDSFPEGVTVITYTATDDCGNEKVASFNITVSSCCDTPPTIICPSDYTGCPGTDVSVSIEGNLSSESGVATATASGSECGDPLITFSDEVISERPCNGSFTLERTWLATDSNNSELQSSCIQVIILEDAELPIISNIPTDITLSPSSSCNAIGTWIAPSATDNCSLQSLSSTHSNGSLFEEGVTTVVYTALDDCGNMATASFSVTVTECCTAPPVIICPSSFTDCIGTSTSPATTGVATATAGSAYCNSPIVAYTDDVISVGPCAGAKEVIRTWTATDPDNSALQSICQQIIILIDDEAPEIFDCPTDITVMTTGSEAQVVWDVPTSTDECGLEWLMGDYNPGDMFPLGTTTVTYSAVDDCENVSLCSFTVTVEQEGTISCPDDINVSCADGNGNVVTWDLPTIDTGCTDCAEGDSIAGFVYMGSLNGSLYYCSTSPANSADASSISHSNGGYLASITSQEENDLLSGFLNTQCALVGYSDSVSEGDFVWASGETSDYENWASWQPNNENGNQDCTVLCTDGWYDTHCGVSYEFIMEIPCTSYQQTTGQPNGSVFDVGVDTITYVVTDACGNSLTCSFTVTVESSASLHCPADHTFECPNGQNGVIAYWDTPELTSCCAIDCGSVTDSIPGYMYMGSYGGSKYYCSLSNAPWPHANAYAQAHGGHLAEINDEGENAFLANILTLQKAWIGLNDVAVEGHFEWSTGNPLSYSNWYPGQPSNEQGFQDYVAMLSNGLWNDEYNNQALEYIMEVPCNSVTQIGGPSSGSVIPVGTSTITYAGMDACGNTDTCSFDITILAPGTCSSYGQDTWYMWIDHIGLGNYDNTSGNNNGYADFTDQDCINVDAGSAYPITLTPGFSSSLYTVYWKVWIDYNHDGDYLDSGEYVAYGSGHSQLSGILPISNQCVLGETTMRVAMKYGNFPSGPCAIFEHGEVEDYCINITGNGNGILGFVGDTSEGAIQLTQSQDLSLAAPSNDIDFDPLLDEVRLSREESDGEFNVFPNPAKDILTLDLNIVGDISFSLFSNAGARVHTEVFSFGKGSQVMDVSNLQNGIYILRSEDGKFSKKVLVQR